jgi:NitT/TauT family transport system permease protein
VPSFVASCSPRLAGVPRIALAPLFVLWFGISDTAKIALSVSLVFFVVLFNMRAGVRSVDGDLLTMSRTLGANRRQIFLSVIMPACVPTLFAGFRLAIVFSVLGVIASEMTAARSGLGMQVVAYSQNLQPDGVFAVLALLAAVMALLNGVLQLIERRLLRWVPA